MAEVHGGESPSNEGFDTQQPGRNREAEDQSIMDAERFRTATRRLYISHSLSTWNSRMFEFGAFLFLADVFPDTLLFASVYALARSLAVFLLSSWVGGIMDTSNRLWAIRASISEQIPGNCSLQRLISVQSGRGSQLLLHVSSSSS